MAKEKKQKLNQMEGSSSARRSSSRLEALPNSLLDDILMKLDFETLFSLSCVSTTLRSSATRALTLLPSLDLSEISPDYITLKSILSRCKSFKTLTLNCLRKDEWSMGSLLRPHIEELNLLCCHDLDPSFFRRIAEKCPNSRVLMLDLWDSEADRFAECLNQMLSKCKKLETICLKIRGNTYPYVNYVAFIPPTIKCLKLEPLKEEDAVQLVSQTDPSASISVNLLLNLQNLSLVLDIISDKLVLSITKCVPHLLELDLKDRPDREATSAQDLTNIGLQSLGTCWHLKSLFLARSGYGSSFKRVDDTGISHLSNGCRELESVGLTGFSEVSAAGFASILHSCPRLKRFEVRKAALLSDLTFHDLSNAPCSLEELKLSSCKLITNETMKNLSTESNLELLNIFGCWSVADQGINSITSLNNLTFLDLAGADITDTALLTLSQGSSPIKSLSLRGCKRITDKGITLLVGGTVSKTLSSLDLGYIPGVTDAAVLAIASAANAVTELCIKSCKNVTDSSLKTLARKGETNDGNSRPLRKLDLYGCRGLSEASLKFFKLPKFRGLRWLGVWDTKLDDQRGIAVVLTERKLLTVCTVGCEMGCYEEWACHSCFTSE